MWASSTQREGGEKVAALGESVSVVTAIRVSKRVLVNKMRYPDVSPGSCPKIGGSNPLPAIPVFSLDGFESGIDALVVSFSVEVPLPSLRVLVETDRTHRFIPASKMRWRKNAEPGWYQ